MSLAMTPETATPAHWALGRLSWDAVPMAHEPIVLWTFIAVVLGGIAVMALITKFRLWGTLWRDWICSIDHKDRDHVHDPGPGDAAARLLPTP